MPIPFVYKYPDVVIIRRLVPGAEVGNWLRQIVVERRCNTENQLGDISIQARFAGSDEDDNPTAQKHLFVGSLRERICARRFSDLENHQQGGFWATSWCQGILFV